MFPPTSGAYAWALQPCYANYSAQSLGGPHRAPRAESNERLLRLSTLPSDEGVHPRLRNPPAAAVQFVGAAEAPWFPPVADGAWVTGEAKGQLPDGEVSFRGRPL